MIYIENEESVGIYEVKINEDSLKNVRKRIIYNCGLITVKIKETTKENLFTSERYIVHSKKQIDTNYNYEPIYEIVYQEIIFPPIVDIISKILNGQEIEILRKLENETNELIEKEIAIYQSIRNKLINGQILNSNEFAIVDAFLQVEEEDIIRNNTILQRSLLKKEGQK